MKNKYNFRRLTSVIALIIFSFFFSHGLLAQGHTVSGKVTDDKGNELPGVSVIVKGTAQGTTSDVKGDFNISTLPENATLVFTYIGMKSKEIPVGAQSIINVSLSEDALGMEEVVVIGYGAVKKSDMTGAVSSISMDDLELLPTPRIDQMLQGRAAGVQITQTNGSPGAGTVIRVRGGNSIEGNNEPLWVIDGIIVGQSFDLNNINPNDIESIEILKDASSVAIYGARGANGVMLVTTKAGTGIGGKPRVSLHASTGVQSPVGKPSLLNGPDQAAYANEDAIYRGVGIPYPDMSVVPNTDWLDIIMRKASITSIDASISGNSTDGNVNYYISANYFNQEGIIPNSGIKKYIFRTNLDVALSPKVKVGARLNLSLLERDNGTVGYGSLVTRIRTVPVFNDDGTYNGFNPISNAPQNNPVFDSKFNINETLTNNFLGTVYLEYRPTKNLVIKSTMNPEINNVKNNWFVSSQSPDRLLIGEGGEASVNNLSSLGWNNENTILYTPKIGEDHKLSALGGITFQKYSAESSYAEAYGLTTDALKFNNLSLVADQTRHQLGSNFDAFQIVSFLSRINYTYKDKYLVTLVGRSDGSSRFAPGNKYAFFPSMALAWNLDKESFIADLGVFSALKLRGSYGKAGSQAIDSYRTLAIMMDARSTYNGIPTTGTTIGRPANNGLKWETTNQLDIGLEAEFFGGRLSATIDYYKKNTIDLLLNVQIPRVTGFDTQLRNLGEVENRGLELLINTVNIIKVDLSWSTDLTLSANRNKVLDLAGADFINRVIPNATQGVAGRLYVGQPAPVFVGVNYLGTWKSQEEIDATNMVNQRVGGARFEDTNGDGVINEADYVIIGNPQPDFIFGINNSFKFKNWDFSIYFQGTYGNDIYNTLTDRAFFGIPETANYAETLNRWTPENPTSNIPRAGTQVFTSTPNNSFMVEDASHIRLKNVSLAYNLPGEKIGMNKIGNITMYLSGVNLALWSNFRLIDPETSRFGTENVAQGFSSAEYPAPRIVTIGLKTTF